MIYQSSSKAQNIKGPNCSVLVVVVSGQVLLKNMLKPLVMYPSLSVRVTEQQSEGTILALQCLEESREERSTPSQVYSKLLLVLNTLHSHLLGTVIYSIML